MFVDLDVKTVELEGFPGVTADLKPLSTGDFQRLAAFFFSRQEGPDSKTLLTGLLGDEAFGKLAKDLVPAYCVAVKGLEVRVDGAPRAATGTDLVTHSRLLGVAIVVLFNLFSISSLGVEEAKKPA